MTLQAQDDRRHALPDHPHARESLYWNVLLPEERLGFMGYCFLKPSGEASSLAAVMDDSMQMRAFELIPDVAFEGTDLDRFRVGPLSVEHGEPLREVTIEFAGEQVQMDWRYTALHEAFDYARNADGCCPAMATNRFEQAGAVQGAFSVDGRSGRFDTRGWRDHSWGVRDWTAMHHYKWISVHVGDDLTFNAMQTLWRGEVRVNGFVLRDGQVSPLVELEIHTDYDAELRQERVRVALHDEAGRTTHAVGERFAGATLPFGGISLSEACCTFEVDGRDGVGIAEYMWPEGYREHVASSGR
jgi:hypothetical protein